MQSCIKQLQQEFGQWFGARKRFKDYDTSTLGPELLKIWDKVLEMQVKSRQVWAEDAGAAAKYQELLDSLKIQVPKIIEKLVQ